MIILKYYCTDDAHIDLCQYDHTDLHLDHTKHWLQALLQLKPDDDDENTECSVDDGDDDDENSSISNV